MDFSGHRRPFPFLLLFSAFLLAATVHSLRPLTASPLPQSSVPDSIKVICNLTTHRSLCISAVKPYLPIPSTATSVILALLQYARNETATDMAIFSDLAKNPETSPKMAAALKDCVMMYGQSLNDYTDTMGAVKVKDWDTAKTHLTAVSSWYGRCADGESPGLPPIGFGPWIAFNRRLNKFGDDCFDLFAHVEKQ